MRSALLLICALVDVLLLSGCASSSPVEPEVPFRMLGAAQLPGVPASAPSVRPIRTRAAWDEYVQASGLRARSGDPGDPLPTIDFSAEMAIAIELGARPMAGFGIDVQRVSRRGPDLIVHVVEVPPCLGAAVITSPVAAVAVPRTAGAVSATWEKTNCR